MDEKNNKKSPVLMIAGIILIVIIAGYFLMAKKSYPPSALEPKESASVKDTDNNADPSNSAQKEIAVLGNEFSFEPSSLTIKSGEKVKLTFKNMGKAPHDLTISELNVATKVIKEGQSDTVEFTAPNSGTFSFICSVGNHAEKGMNGTVKVE